MSDKLINLAIEYAAMRLGCERAYALLTDPDASEFDAENVIRLLTAILKQTAINNGEAI
jgi:electron transfer flavoprotein alpha/beta subunit